MLGRVIVKVIVDEEVDVAHVLDLAAPICVDSHNLALGPAGCTCTYVHIQRGFNSFPAIVPPGDLDAPRARVRRVRS